MAKKEQVSINSGKQPDERWTIRLGSRDGHALEQLCSSHLITDSFGKIEQHAQKLVLKACLHAFAKRFCKDKKRPSNPNVINLLAQTPDCQSLFVFNDKFKICVESPTQDDQYQESWAKKTVTQTLVDAGVKPAHAKKFVEREIEVAFVTHFLTLQEMIDGKVGPARNRIKPDELTRSAGLKFEAFMKWDGKKTIHPLTDEERDAISYVKMEYRLQPGMLDRIFEYCEEVAELEAFFSVIQPVLSLKNHEFGLGDNPSNRIDRLQTKFNDVFHAGE